MDGYEVLHCGGLDGSWQVDCQKSGYVFACSKKRGKFQKSPSTPGPSNAEGEACQIGAGTPGASLAAKPFCSADLQRAQRNDRSDRCGG